MLSSNCWHRAVAIRNVRYAQMRFRHLCLDNPVRQFNPSQHDSKSRRPSILGSSVLHRRWRDEFIAAAQRFGIPHRYQRVVRSARFRLPLQRVSRRRMSIPIQLLGVVGCDLQRIHN